MSQPAAVQCALIPNAPAPFSGDPDPDHHRLPDFILRSSDDVDFHIHKEVLKFASVVFDDMFTLPAGNGDPSDLSKNGIPILAVPEPSAVLYRLLGLVYPAQTVGLYTLVESDLNIIFGVHVAADKYQFLCVLRLLNQMLETCPLIEVHPHRFFAIARLRGLSNLAQKAALRTLHLPVTVPALRFPEMKLLSWDVVQQLHDFHHKCGTVAQSIIEDVVRGHAFSFRSGTHNSSAPPLSLFDHDDGKLFVWWDWTRGHAEGCGPINQVSGEPLVGQPTYPLVRPAPWLQNHVEQLALQARLRPSHRTLQQKADVVAPSNNDLMDACPACSSRAASDLVQFGEQLALRIQESNAKLVQDL
ncbi:hypothetical protein C8R44DRAFT_715268 [Mycena epipterygia]|nr:hypothetical protein C8R44DRAFT_715268 [Mycena epipterygia]